MEQSRGGQSMITMDELREYRVLCAEERRLLDEIARWRSAAERVTPTLAGVRFTRADGGRIEMAVEKMDTLRACLAARLTELADRRRRIEQAITALDDARLAHLIRLRYIDGLTFEVIAARMGLSYQWTHKLHRDALARLLDEKSRIT